MQGTNIVHDIVEILGAGIADLGAKIGTGVNSFVTALAFTGEGNSQTLSIYFVVVLVFAGVALAIALTSRIFTWLSTLGN